jgi:hypothetical protein
MPKAVYEDVLTQASADRLRSLVTGIPHPVAIAGGHAVLHNVRQRWKARFGQDYFGSRDIDVIYRVDPTWSQAQVEASAAAQAPTRIEKLGYKPISFRYQQILDDKGRVLEKEPNFTIEDVTLFRLYIDPMVTHQHPHLERVWHFKPIDEPLLTPVFLDPQARWTTKEFGDQVFIPAPPYLVATKLKSLKTRTKDDKAVKDLCDLYALTAYGGADQLAIRRVVHALLPDAVPLVQGAITSDHLPKALDHLDLDRNAYQAVIGPLAARP